MSVELALWIYQSKHLIFVSYIRFLNQNNSINIEYHLWEQ